MTPLPFPCPPRRLPSPAVSPPSPPGPHLCPQVSLCPMPALSAPARRAPGRPRLPQRCQPRCLAWVWDGAPRGAPAAQGLAGSVRAGRAGGRGRAWHRLSPRASGWPRSAGARGALGARVLPPRARRTTFAEPLPLSRSHLNSPPTCLTEGMGPRSALCPAQTPVRSGAAAEAAKVMTEWSVAGAHLSFWMQRLPLFRPTPACLPPLTRQGRGLPAGRRV